ncbi:MAG TPA: sugar ABC transporter permease [Chloroflexota bacterium]|jgi:sn-glycerol 3-phosphate transport system permease protein|nr:sugar ABC transporter permease [Chloroflexota bacterium]
MTGAVPAVPPARGARAGWRRAGSAYLYLLPSFVFLVVFNLWPLLEVIDQSLYQINLLAPTHPFVGLGNYRALLTSPLFWQVVRNSVTFAVGTIVPSLVLALALALILNRSLPLLGLYRTAVFYPTVLPMISAAAIWVFVYIPSYGLLDRALSVVGLSEINWLGTASTALPAVIISTIWRQTGYYMIFFLAGLQGISTEVLEASEIDGANGLQQLRYLILPLLSPTTAFVTTIALVAGIQAFDQVFLMTQGGPDNATNLPLYLLYQIAFMNWDTGQAAALTVLLLGVLFAIGWTNYRLMDRQAHYG